MRRDTNEAIVKKDLCKTTKTISIIINIIKISHIILKINSHSRINNKDIISILIIHNSLKWESHQCTTNNSVKGSSKCNNSNSNKISRQYLTNKGKHLLTSNNSSRDMEENILIFELIN